ncbi:hypothetical protein B5G21_04600 [Enorma massiliensis]|uniref:Tyr recombinase domain-containing protein n=2 Tax=Enorma massiliensis TaxID=1472761 RepID=A0A1Y3UAL8_9ACTN|nr:hypothetical protein B5G21_04600 [Enorma massiliensis]
MPYTNVFDNPVTDPLRLEPIEIDSKQSEVRCGDALFTVSSETPQEVGMSSVWLSDQHNVYLNSFCFGYRQDGSFDNLYLAYMLRARVFRKQIEMLAQGISRFNISKRKVMELAVPVPGAAEQRAIGAFFSSVDELITLHQRKLNGAQRKPVRRKEGKKMAAQMLPTSLFCDYYRDWIATYKEGAIRKVTMDKYLLTASWLERIVPSLSVSELDRGTYQQLLNRYAEYHERQTTMDFHHQLKSAILDAVDEGLINRDPTRKAVIKGKPPRVKKPKYLNQFELHKLLDVLNLEGGISWDWLILLIAKTGLRFSEALAVTPDDFIFSRQVLSIDKTWDYKENGGFLPTKNRSSIRKVQIDWQLIIQFSELIKNMPPHEPIFVHGKVYNSTVNGVLGRRCREAGVPEITIHGLRHTHASLLLFAGVSIASVAKRLGHSSMTTTQKVYLHVIQELENQDIDLVMRSLSGLC